MQEASDTPVPAVPSAASLDEAPRYSLAAILLSLSAAIFAWNAFIWAGKGTPTLGTGLFFLALGGLAAANRPKSARTPLRWVFLAMLAASAAQSALEYSFSNFVTMLTLVVLIAWEGTAEPAERWLRVLEGGLSFWRPLGLAHVVVISRKPRFFVRPKFRTFIVFLAALWLCLFFAALLSTGNAVLGKLLGDIPEVIAKLAWLPGAVQVIGWIFAAYVAMALVFHPGRSFVSRQLSVEWPRFRVSDASFIMDISVWSLAGLNLLFLLNNGVDVVYLWFSHGLPEGVTYSQYVHNGVNILTLTTVLSAGLIAILAQNPPEVVRHRPVRILCWLWMAQNAFLVLGVFKRLALYVDSYGYTPKRIYVALFLCLVLGGYALLVSAFRGDRGIKWLVRGNLTLLFFYFFAIQFVDAARISANLNLGLLREGKITLRGQVSADRDIFGFDSCEHLDSYGVFVLATVANDASFPAGMRVEAGTILDKGALWPGNPFRCRSWQAIQLADVRNYAPYYEYLKTRPKAATPKDLPR
ncbi:MAG TPA: DUF4173 domain-containing protein [Opitutales bacterium]|nr:DUF4173 domain-containing protein [Opitutales bacterium]